MNPTHRPTLRSPRSIHRLTRDVGGTAAIEFAFILPLLLVAVIGCLEIAILLFLTASIETAVGQASRFGSTGGNGSGISREERVFRMISEHTYGLIDVSKMTLDTLVYPDFADIGQPEPYTDANDNGLYDAGERYIDVNGNEQWDVDMGRAGLGGPSDVVVYRVRYTWGLLTPFVQRLMGAEITQTASAAMRNEPF
jgi:Flp pilus assembly pilin Flp